MFKRHHIRIKALQALYRTYIKDNNHCVFSLKDSIEFYKILVKEGESLMYCFLDLLCQVADKAEAVARIETAKNLVENINTIKTQDSLTQNPIIAELKKIIATYVQQNKKQPFKRISDSDIAYNIFLKLTETEIYATYLNRYNTDTQDIENHKNILIFILQHLIIENDTIECYIEDYYLNSFDDADRAIQALTQSIKKYPFVNNTFLVIDLENIAFGEKLVETVYIKKQYLENQLIEEVKHWQLDRIINLDMVILKMALAEILYFDKIPIKVTLNEYIELAKEYSTAESKLFVNGVLDNVQKKLALQGLLSK